MESPLKLLQLLLSLVGERLYKIRLQVGTSKETLKLSVVTKLLADLNRIGK